MPIPGSSATALNPEYFFHVGIELYHKPRNALRNPDIWRTRGNKCFASDAADEAGGNIEEEQRRETEGRTVADWRKDKILLRSIDMVNPTGAAKRSSTTSSSAVTKDHNDHTTTNTFSALNGESASDSPQSKGSSGARLSSSLGTDANGFATQGRFEPTDPDDEELGWGVVRLYRDSEATDGLYDEPTKAVTKSHAQKHSTHDRARGHDGSRLGAAMENEGREPFKDEDCTTLCILAVPSYLTPSDFLGFVGEKTREEVSHFRMVRTERGNRYMVLMKFRSGRRARDWRASWNGVAFNDMESENMHVVFVKSIKFRAREVSEDSQTSFPDMTNDPFTPSSKADSKSSKSSLSSTTTSATLSTKKPIAPPTPSLVELPTCPVCLERMDESTGLLTILCQHVFHCSCLQKWRGSGCPVCRYTQEDISKRNHQDGEQDAGLNECAVCRSDVNLWVCLICGTVGCGRYDAAHAFLHYKQTSHCFAMDLMTQRVWDYASDGYVHRIMQSKSDGKLVELPSARADYDHGGGVGGYEDSVPKEKLDSLAVEYTHLLMSQLESQRLYFEEKVERAADKASQASRAAETATLAAEKAVQALSGVQAENEALTKQKLPELEKERDRTGRRAERFEGMARKLEKEWREEKAVSGSLMERIEWLDGEVGRLRADNEELKEMNRDMGFFISGQKKLEGLELGEEVVEGTMSLPEEKGAKGKGKKKGKKSGSAGAAPSVT